MTIRTALSQGAALLEQGGVDSPKFTAELLLACALRCERVYFFAHPEQELREGEQLHYGRYLHERLQGRPAQHITRRQEFYGREFRVGPEVLIPRPETELLVETVLKLRPGARIIVDAGTGSGAIAVTLALESKAHVMAVDFSRAALGVAAANAYRLDARVGFMQSDWLAAIASESVDVVVSNPPYIAETDRATLQPEVRDHEPAMALFAGADGLDAYRKLIPEAWRVLRPGGLLALELGFGQAEAVAALVSNFTERQILADLASIERVLVCQKPADCAPPELRLP